MIKKCFKGYEEKSNPSGSCCCNCIYRGDLFKPGYDGYKGKYVCLLRTVYYQEKTCMEIHKHGMCEMHTTKEEADKWGITQKAESDEGKEANQNRTDKDHMRA